MVEQVDLPEVNVTGKRPVSSPVSSPASMQTVSSPFAVRKINLTFQLGTGNYGTSTATPVTYTGLRVVAKIEFTTTPDNASATILVYGLTLSDMNALTQAGLVWRTRDNLVTLQAGDDLIGMATVFRGLMLEAYPEISQPDSPLHIEAIPSSLFQLKPVVTSTFPGAASAATVFGTLAKGAGLTLENNGVNAVLSNPYFWGTSWQQILSAGRAANAFVFVDTVAGVLAIWPKDGSRAGAALQVSPATGMIGYPNFQANQVTVHQLFAPNNLPAVGKTMQITSQIPAATGKFTITSVNFDLASQLPDGPWEQTIVGVPV